MSKSVLIKWYVVIKKELKLLLYSFFLPAIIAYGVSFLLPKKYKSSVTALLPEVASGGSFIETPLGPIVKGGTSAISTQAVVSILNSNLVVDRIVNRFKIKELFNKKNEQAAREFFKSQIMGISADENKGVLTITIKSPYNELNPKIANSLVHMVDSVNLMLRLTSEKNILKVLDWAEPAEKAYSPQYLLNMLIAGVIGLLTALIYIYFKEDLSLSDD